MDELQTAQINALIAELRAQRDYFADKCVVLSQQIAGLNLKIKSYEDQAGGGSVGSQNTVATG